MPRQSSGLIKRWSKDGTRYVWYIKKEIDGHKLRESTGTDNRIEAEQILARRIDELRQELKFGEAPEILFEQAAARYLEEHASHKAIRREIDALDIWMPHIGHLPLRQVHDGTLNKPIKDRQREVSNSTINRDLAPVKRILELSARLWRHESNGNPWLAVPPLIRTLPTKHTKRPPYPISWAEQRLLFPHLDPRVAAMATLDIHTGMRDVELTSLEWNWEVEIAGGPRGFRRSAFIVPGWVTKNDEPRVVFLNTVAQRIIDERRGVHPRWVWPSIHPTTYHKQATGRMLNSSWKRARTKAAKEYPLKIGGEAPWGFANLRAHDLRHTFGRRLRAAGVGKEDRADLLGHKRGDVTTHYSAAELEHLIECVDKVCEDDGRPMLRLVRTNTWRTA
ncbi:tyrosine-type recombinase/integrase [Salinisphaera hydrothermalis]|uniref:Phage integrase family protein n=1 Tax=Salinisphaera hydrothermalis (strain C41B8) TaxID=1304275 RepID=A0A084INS8_SALHC|nr:tyrosine-type recombinase/integrase [Salinisphaera hydrothermalis]KEZ78362.1 phage integrase family protein [Salinisphaera hydrothermalis C41B8]